MKKHPISTLIAGLLLTAGCHAALAADLSAETSTTTTSASSTSTNTADPVAPATTDASSTTPTTTSGSTTSAVPMCTSTDKVTMAESVKDGQGGDDMPSLTGDVSTASDSASSTSGDCISAEHDTSEDDAGSVVNDLIGGGSKGRGATVVRDPATGVMSITLPDGRVFEVAPVGKTRKHKRSGAAQMDEDGNGNLRLVSTSGDEVTLSASTHDPVELKTQLEKQGYSDISISGGHIEANTQDGKRISLSTDMTVASTTASGSGKVEDDSDGALKVTYTDGVIQSTHAHPHDLDDLKKQASNLGVLDVTLNADGTLNATISGQKFRLRMSVSLQQGQKTQPGIRIENGKIIVQYSDGMEQEITQAP